LRDVIAGLSAISIRRAQRADQGDGRDNPIGAKIRACGLLPLPASGER
jgi:hypothetical protein